MVIRSLKALSGTWESKSMMPWKWRSRRRCAPSLRRSCQTVAIRPFTSQLCLKGRGAIQIRGQSWISLSDLRLAYPHNGICDGLSICVQRFHCRYRISGDTVYPIF
ncbi:hypothetical protein EMIT0P100_120198 [Pseudomonas sp. IT-P100]